MIFIKEFIKDFPIAGKETHSPWDITKGLAQTITDLIATLDSDFIISDGVAIHKSATIEQGVTMKPPVIICANGFVGANAYLRGGVYLAESVVIGPSCEIKSSVIASRTSIAHFNFIGDSLIGSNVNFEAGALTANHHNDRADKRIYVVYKSSIIDTGSEKFGSLVGDNSKIGANAVLSPGTILEANSVVRRLELVDQIRYLGG